MGLTEFHVRRTAKKLYYRDTDQMNEKEILRRHTWKLINEIINKTKLTSKLEGNFVKDGKMISDPNEMAEHFNEYFINLWLNLADKIPTSLRDFETYFEVI